MPNLHWGSVEFPLYIGVQIHHTSFISVVIVNADFGVCAAKLLFVSPDLAFSYTSLGLKTRSEGSQLQVTYTCHRILNDYRDISN